MGLRRGVRHGRRAIRNVKRWADCARAELSPGFFSSGLCVCGRSAEYPINVSDCMDQPLHKSGRRAVVFLLKQLKRRRANAAVIAAAPDAAAAVKVNLIAIVDS